MKIEELEKELQEIRRRVGEYMVNGNIAVWTQKPDAGEHYKAAELLLVEASRITREIASLKGA
jgi:hypothetical protein